MLINSIVWDVNPEIFRIGNFAIRWYGLLFAMSFIFGYYIMLKIFKKEGVPEKFLDKLTSYMVIATIIGARLGHCLFYEPAYFLSHPIEILKIWEGGLASHGAGIGIVAALLIFSKQNKKSFLWVIDRIVIVVALSGFFIRMGNLMNSEIIGTLSDLPWAFVFIKSYDQLLAIDPRHPAQLYEALSYLLIFIYLMWEYFKKSTPPKNGFLFSMFLILVFSSRFIIEFIKIRQVDFEENMFLNMGQLLSIPFVIAGFVLLYFSGKRKEKRN
ncbi:MAG: prolipoprotein diacylglyceryl transferase [Bacteroidales bacterium]|nr:prolipoprotein diacylglyceryl transferase [Bacteroidales bacterium]